MSRSHIIEIAGIVAGKAIYQRDGYRFVAEHPHLKAMDRTIWSSLNRLRRVAQRLVGSQGAKAAAAVDVEWRSRSGGVRPCDKVLDLETRESVPRLTLSARVTN